MPCIDDALQLEHEAERIHHALHRAVAIWRNRQRHVTALRKMHDDMLDRYIQLTKTCHGACSRFGPLYPSQTSAP